MFARKTTAVAVGLSAMFICAAGAIVMNDIDYSQDPPTAAHVRKQLDELNIKMSKAIDIAQHEANGIAKTAVLHLNHNPAVFEIDVYSTDKAHKLFINGTNGEVFSNTVTDGPWTATESGLRYFDIKEGSGQQPTAADTVTVHYSGWLIDGKKFDSSLDRGQPISFPLAGVIKGWTEGVSGMKVGGKRKLIIPYQMAYGEMGRPPVIPAKATLVFEVELLSIMGHEGHDHDHSGHDHHH